MKQIICNSCRKPIKSNKDLVTSLYFFFVRAYHSKCYSSNLKSIRTLFIRNHPINGVSGTLSAIMGPIMGLLVMLGFALNPGNFPMPVVFVIVLLAVLMPPFIRLYSYYKFEKPLIR